MSYKAKIVEAIQEFNDRTGSSSIAIKKHIMAANPDLAWKNSVFLTTLSKSVADGDFIQIKKSYYKFPSYKLSSEYKKELADALNPKKPQKNKQRGPWKRRASAGLPDTSFYDHGRVVMEHEPEVMRPALWWTSSREGQSMWGGGSMSSVTIEACVIILIAVLLYRRKKN